MRTHLTILPVAFGLAACAAEAEPDLLVPDAVSVTWSDTYDGSEDGLGAVVPVDVMVYDSATGAPLPGVELGIASEHDGTWVVPGGRVRAVEADAWLEDDTWLDDERVLFDTRHDRYVTLDADAGELRAGATTVVTNPDGVARVLLYVDRFPSGANGFSDVAVVVSASGDVPLERIVLLQPR